MKCWYAQLYLFKSAGMGLFLSLQKGEFMGDVNKNIDNLNLANP